MKNIAKKNNWPYAILEELLAQYGESPTDLSRFLITTIGIPKDDLVRAKKVKDILEHFTNEGVLTWKAAQWVKHNDFENWNWQEQALYMAFLGNEKNGMRETWEIQGWRLI